MALLRPRPARNFLRRLIGAVVALAFFGFVGPGPRAAAQDAAPKEYEIKALFLFNFLQFIEWPQNAFADANAPVRIGILGQDPFAGALDAVVQGEKVRNRPIAIVRSGRVQDLANCHAVFIGSSERFSLAAVLSTFGGRPVLTVGDMPGFAQRGGIVNFYFEGQRLRFEINRAAAQRSGLKLSSQLLVLARLVGPAVEPGGR